MIFNILTALLMLLSPAPRHSTGYEVAGSPTISYREFSDVMAAHHTLMPASDVLHAYRAGVKAGIDPAIYLVIICKESTCASRGRVTAYCRNFGNIKWRQGEPRCPYADGSYRSYASWQEATDDWYSIIKTYYVGMGITTLPALVRKYYRGDTETYIEQVTSWLAQWRREDANR